MAIPHLPFSIRRFNRDLAGCRFAAWNFVSAKAARPKGDTGHFLIYRGAIDFWFSFLRRTEAALRRLCVSAGFLPTADKKRPTGRVCLLPQGDEAVVEEHPLQARRVRG